MKYKLLRKVFGTDSANPNRNNDLLIRSAALFPGQLTALLEHSHIKKIEILNIEDLNSPDNGIGLKRIFNKRGTDKSRRHNYHRIYSYIFENLGTATPIRLLEIGIGTNNPDLPSSMGIKGVPGASLRSFREYLPNAEIFGADIDKDILFSEPGIKTAFVNQLDSTSFDQMHTEFGNKKYHVVIDDGLHSLSANLNTLLFALSNIHAGGWIVIEDIHRKRISNWKIIDSILNSNADLQTFMVDTNMWSWVYLVKKINTMESS